MPTQRVSPRQERRKARTREAIIDAAEEFFADDPDAATIARIADAADVAVATVYQHFAGKDDLHLAVVERALKHNEGRMMAVYQAEQPALEKLIDAAGAYFGFYLESPRLFRLVGLRHGKPTDESTSGPVAVMLVERVERMTMALAGVFEQGMAEGSMRPVDALAAARFGWGAINGVTALAQRPDRLRLTDAELRDTMVLGLELWLEGLVADSHRGPDGRLPQSLRDRVRAVIEGAS